MATDAVRHRLLLVLVGAALRYASGKSPAEFLSVVCILPADELTFWPTSAAVQMAVQDTLAVVAPNITFGVRTKYLADLKPGGSEDLLDFLLTELHEPTTVASIGLSSASTVDFLAPLLRQLDVPLITTSLSRRVEWDGAAFSTLLYGSPSGGQLAWLTKDLIQTFSWSRVCVFYSQEFSSLPSLREFITTIGPLYGIAIADALQVELDPSAQIRLSTTKAMEKLRANNCNIFVACLSTDELLPTMREASAIGLTSQGSAWLFLDFLVGPMLLPSELRKYMDGALLVRPREAEDGHPRLLRFAKKLKAFDPSAYPCDGLRLECISMEAAFAHDAAVELIKSLPVWASLPVEEARLVQVHKNLSFTALTNGRSLVEELQQTSWDGVVGPVSFKGLDNPRHGYDVFNLRDGHLELIGNWTEKHGVVTTRLIRWPGRSNVAPESKRQLKKQLRVLVPSSAPFSYYLKTPPLENSDFAGVAVDLLHNVSVEAGFNYTFQWWNGTWDEMVELAGNTTNDYDMAIGSITVKGHRALVCNFTRTFFLTGLKMLALRPKAEPPGNWDFLRQFHWSVWLALGVTVLLSAVVMRVLDPEGIATARTGHWYFDALFFTSNVFIFVHEADAVNSKLARAFLLVLQFLMHIFLTAYTANMASFLSVKQGEFTFSMYTDIIHSDVAARNGTTNWLYAKNDLGVRHLVDVVNAQGAVSALRSESVKVYLADIPHLDGIASRHCDLVVIGDRVRPSFNKQASSASKSVGKIKTQSTMVIIMC